MQQHTGSVDRCHQVDCFQHCSFTNSANTTADVDIISATSMAATTDIASALGLGHWCTCHTNIGAGNAKVQIG